ncbi:hypothetical protein [Photobacterium sp. 1_MG-2023]|uniref:hypothetical protein n=1 Tax=Photobacterium sp. 1_MG-2023 TaxID=3062646 RepID=UPI0026E482E8|nr:hypothetical protein [Photobacterium sp. 1_MG-2023]MDO6707668.1 hypothetical protein [Photobacterium sp. 1_MG-2023]
MRNPLNQRWQTRLLTLVFSLFILASPLQVLHTLDALTQPHHAEQDCPCHHIVSGDVPPARLNLPLFNTASIEVFHVVQRFSDWLIARSAARDPPEFSL